MDGERLGGSGPQTFSDEFGLSGFEVFAQHGELVAAQACGRVPRTEHRGEPLGELLQHQVAGGVAVGVVTNLKPLRSRKNRQVGRVLR